MRRIPVQVDAGTYRNGSITLTRATDAIAAKDPKGNVWLAVVNLDPTRSVQIHPIIANHPVRFAHGETLTAAQVDSVNTFDSKPAVQPTPLNGITDSGGMLLELPAKSVSVVQLR